MTISRRDVLKAGLTAAALAGGGFSVARSIFAQDAPDLPPSPLKPATMKPPYRNTIDPFEVQKNGYVVYHYGTHEKTTPKVGVKDWYALKGHNFAGCRSYPMGEGKTLTREEVRKHWESQGVVPVFMTGADPKAGVERVRAGWEQAAKEGYRAMEIDEFYPAPRTPVEYDTALAEFKKQHPEIFLQVWEADFPAGKVPFPHLEIFSPFVDNYMPEVYWKWYKKDDVRRKLFRQLIDRARKIGTVKKLAMGLGTHDVDHLKKSMEDIPAILDMEPGIGGFAFFVHIGEMGPEYDKLYARLDDQLRDLFQR